MTEKSYRVTGMTCASCAAHAEKAASRLPGVAKCGVNIATEKMTVEFDEHKVGFGEFKKAVEDAGYGLVEEQKAKKLEILVEGMTCAACSAAVERAIRKLPGVKSASVNLATNRAAVEYDPAQVKLSEIKAAVVDAGYTPKEAAGEAVRDMEKEQRERALKNMRTRLIVAAVFAAPILYIAMSHMFPALKLPIPYFMGSHNFPLMFAMVQLALTIPVILAGSRFFRVGFKTLLKGSPNMDTLVAIGTGSAFLYGIYATVMIYLGDFAFAQSLYFESAAVVITLVMLGKYMEAVSKGKTSEAIKKLMNLKPKTAVVIKDGAELEVPLDEVAVGDIVLVRPGTSVPVDGIVTEGVSAVDESMLTGESLPVEKQADSPVTGGSINGEGLIKFRVTRVGEDTALMKIIKLVEEAQGKKAPIAKLADVISGYFVPAVLGIALLAAIVWALTGRDFNFVLNTFVTVLVIACPCALGLATPTAIMVGTGKGAELGILIKGGEALETTHKLNAVVFDKTGTITEGKPVLTDVRNYGSLDETEVLLLAASAERGSEHPIARAIVKGAEDRGMELAAPETFKAVPGRGIDALVQGRRVLAGNVKLMTENGIGTQTAEADAKALSASGRTLMYVAVDGRLEALLAAADTVKPSSRAAVEKLKKLGVEIYMITGDNRNTADAIAKEVHIDHVLSDVLPGEKASEVKKLQESGKKVAMVGDGINDAPALVQADVGMAIGTGTDVAVESADVVLMRGDLNEVSSAIALSRATIRNIRQNLFWAFIYNLAGIPLAAGVLYAFGGPLLNPIFAGAAMALSSVSVVSNALRLKRFKIKNQGEIA
jgi:Cu+-exporting ATPase